MSDDARILVNKSRSRVLAKKVRFASTPFQKFRGLMFRRKPDYAMIFQSSVAGRLNLAMHMFFVFFPIDAVYLRKSRVVGIFRNVKPFTPYLSPAKESDTLVELPAGTISGENVRIGDFLSIK